MKHTDHPPKEAPQDVWERERARRTLLTQLGIQPLVSRVDGIAARPAARLVAPSATLQIEVNDTVPTGEMEGAALRELLRGDGSSAMATDQAPISDPVVSGDALEPITNGTPEATMPLSLLMVVSDDLLWIEQLEDQLLRQEQLKLIAAMARAIRGAEVHCTHQQFDWPPAGQVSPAGTQHDLREMLSGYLHRLTVDHAIAHTIHLGSCAVLPDSGMPVTQVPSSLDLLRDATQKPRAWEALKPLRR